MSPSCVIITVTITITINVTVTFTIVVTITFTITITTSYLLPFICVKALVMEVFFVLLVVMG